MAFALERNGEKLIKNKSLRFIVFVYGIVLICALVYSLFCYLQDRFYIKSEKIVQTEFYNYDNFELSSMDIVLTENYSENNAAISTSHDPQLLINNINDTGTQIVRDIKLDVEYGVLPGEVVLYYASFGQPFSDDNKTWGKQQNDGSYMFYIPRNVQIQSIRIDPTNQISNTIKLNSVSFNTRLNLSQYFMPTNEQLFNFLLYPGIAAAFLFWLSNEIFADKKLNLKNRFPILRKKTGQSDDKHA